MTIMFIMLMVMSSTTVNAEPLTGRNVLVLYKKLDGLSKKVADYYAEQRHVPTAQVVAVDILSSPDVLSRQKFEAIQQQIAPYLTKQIKVIVMTWHAPYRVECMSMTSAMTFGFDEKFCSHTSLLKTGCHETAQNPFYNDASAMLWKRSDLRLSMMLSGQNFAEAKALIDRGVAADKRAPSGHAYLVNTQDSQRSSRAVTFKRLTELWPEQKGIKLHYIDDSNKPAGTSVKNKQNVMFYFTGYAQVPDINSNDYLPGAIADHLTSYGGAGIKKNGQMKLYRWLESGVTGSYGTVVEPCSYPAKFPNPLILIPAYLSGETLIEAYWKSVQQPGEGIFVGEALARPWAN